MFRFLIYTVFVQKNELIHKGNNKENQFGSAKICNNTKSAHNKKIISRRLRKSSQMNKNQRESAISAGDTLNK